MSSQQLAKMISNSFVLCEGLDIEEDLQLEILQHLDHIQEILEDL